MLQNFTLDDASPLIRYDASWNDGYNSTADSQMSRYQGRSFYVTYTNGATANITFRGTDIYLYGAKRNNHGYYSVMVDGEPSVPMSGRPAAGTDELFQTLLFARQGLTNGDHTLVLTNEVEDQERVWLDVDYIVITREVETSMVPSVIATHEEFTYSSLWSTQSGMTGYRNSTTHRTNTPGETATLIFRGSELFLYGGVGPDFGTFKVQVDNQDPVVLNATRGFTHPPVTLFTTSGLDDGQHTLTITNLEGGKSLTINYAEYTPTSSPSRSKSNAGLIGGAVGGVLGALVVLALLVWFIIRRRKRARNDALDEPLPPITASPQWNNHAQLTPYVAIPSQPPVGYVGHRPEILSTHTPTARKSDMVVPPLATIRSGESTYESTLQYEFSSLGSPTDIASIHEVDAGALTLPPMYDQVFSTPPPPRNSTPT